MLSWIGPTHGFRNSSSRCHVASPTLYRNEASPSGVSFPLVGMGRDLFWSNRMNGLIYLIGLIVVIMAILSFFGLR